MIGPAGTAPTAPLARRRRWWHRALGLRGLMLLVLVLGGGMGFAVRREVERRGAIATIRVAGGGVYTMRDMGFVGGPWTWLARRTGVDWFEEVGTISLIGMPPSRGAPAMSPAGLDAALAAVPRVGSTQILYLAAPTIRREHLARLADARVDDLRLMADEPLPDDTLAELARFRRIKGLTILMWRGNLPREAIRAVGGLTQLESLTLNCRAARTDRADLAPLARLRGLKKFALEGGALDDESLDVLDSLDRMEELDLGGTRITDATLRRMVDRMPRLKTLKVDGSALTDAGVEALARLPNLWSVALEGDSGAAGQLTDASLVALGRTPTLRYLVVTCGRFGPAGLDALRPLPLRWLGLGAIGPGSEAALGRLLAGRTFARLMLHGPGVTDAIVPSLAASLEPWSDLMLGRSALTDAAAPGLAALSIRGIDLSRTALSDAGLATFAAGMAASELVARETAITPAGAAAFEAARPGTGFFTGRREDED